MDGILCSYAKQCKLNCFVKEKKKVSAEWRVLWEGENTKVAHFSGVATTRRESIKEAHTRPPIELYQMISLILLITAMGLNYNCSSGIGGQHYSLSCVALT